MKIYIQSYNKYGRASKSWKVLFTRSIVHEEGFMDALMSVEMQYSDEAKLLPKDPNVVDLDNILIEKMFDVFRRCLYRNEIPDDYSSSMKAFKAIPKHLKTFEGKPVFVEDAKFKSLFHEFLEIFNTYKDDFKTLIQSLIDALETTENPV